MKAKWYSCTLIFILVLFGFTQEQTYLPNQEIVVQFTGDEAASDDVQNTIALVRKQLQIIGVDNIQVRESADGRLKITYYSAIDVDSIKELFSQEKSLELGYTSYSEGDEHDQFPSERGSNSYELSVFEIQNCDDLESDFNGYILEVAQKNKRLYKPVVYFSIYNVDNTERNRIEKTAFVTQRNIASTLDNSSYNIPEVRAGPLYIGNS